MYADLARALHRARQTDRPMTWAVAVGLYLLGGAAFLAWWIWGRP